MWNPVTLIVVIFSPVFAANLLVILSLPIWKKTMDKPAFRPTQVLVLAVSLCLIGASSMPSCYAADAEAETKTKTEAKTESSASEKSLRGGDADKVTLVEDMPPLLFWKAQGDAASKGTVLCLHELGMHKGSFDDLGGKLAKEGYDVYSMDLRGFGGWAERGKEGRMDLKNTLADIKVTVEKLKKDGPDKQIFLLGEAMGGALALEAASKYPDIIAGTISATPGGEHFNTFSNYLSVGSKMAVMPNKRYNKGEELVALGTPKKELQEAIKNDAGVRLDLSPRELIACQFYMYKTKRFAKRIKTMPVLIVQGERDGESRPDGSRKVFDNLSTDKKQYLSVKDGDHYVYEDTNVNDQAMKTTVAWLDKHTSTN